MHKFGLGLIVALVCVAPSLADPAEIQARMRGHLQKKEFDKAAEVAKAIPDPTGRSLMLLAVAHAQGASGNRSGSEANFQLAVEAARAIPDPTERALRLGMLAWAHERQLQQHTCSKPGGLYSTAAALLEEAGKDFAKPDPARMRAVVDGSGAPADRMHAGFVVATVLHASGKSDDARRVMAEACAAVRKIERLDLRVRLLMEAANMLQWMGDAEGCELLLRDARHAAFDVERLEVRLVMMRTIAEAYAEIGSRDGLRLTMPPLREGLAKLPAQRLDMRTAWYLELAKLQSRVGDHEQIRDTLNRFEHSMADITKAHGMNPNIRKALDEAADLRLENHDLQGFMRYAAQRCPSTSERNKYYERRVRWLLGLRSGETGDLLSGIGGRKPSERDMATGVAVAAAIRIQSVPFRPVPGGRVNRGKRDDAADRRDALFGEIVERGVEFGHVSAAEGACAYFVDPDDMASALMDVARAHVKAGTDATALPLLDRAWLCLEARAPETSKAAFVEYGNSALRGGKYAGLARLYNDVGQTDRALESLDRVSDMYKRAQHPSSRYMLAQYLTTSHYGIGDTFNAKRYCTKFIEIVVAGKDPFQGLLDATIPLDLSGYADGVRACLDRAQPMADDTTVPVATRFDRYLKLAAARNGKLEDGSGEALASAALRLTAATQDVERRKEMLNRVLGDCTMIGAPKTLVAAFDLHRPFKSDAERDRTLLASVEYVCKRGLRRRHLGVNPILAATVLSDACTDPRMRATGYMAVVSRCYRDRKMDEGDRMLAMLRGLPASGAFLPEQSIAIAMGEWLASVYKRDDAEVACKLWESSYARLANAPEDESDQRLAQRASTLAQMSDGQTPDRTTRATDAAHAMAKRISDAARQASVLERISKKTG